MNILFVHNNFPAQFVHLATALAGEPQYRVAAIGSQTARPLPGVNLRRYRYDPQGKSGTHAFARRFEAESRRAEEVLYAATGLKADGFVPDMIIVHCGWGESLPLRAVFPAARFVVYCEFYYRAEGQDVHFDPEMPRLGVDGLAAVHARNASTLLALAEADLAISPTVWQRSTYPVEFQSKIVVCHEGVDLERCVPDPAATLSLPSGRVLRRTDEVLTYVARDLEPYRGFNTVMRALPEILAARSKAEIVIIGSDALSYGTPPPGGGSWKQFMLGELGGALDTSRVHFVGRLPYPMYLNALQVSTVHLYLTYPFVLSWSFIEAMAVGCRIVASDTAPVTDVVDGSCALMVPFSEPRALAAQAVAVLADRRAHDAMAQRARNLACVRYDKRLLVPKLRQMLGLARTSSGRI